MLAPPAFDSAAQNEQIVVERIEFPSAAYRLEGELAYAEGRIANPSHALAADVGRICNPSCAALIAGPHPFLGGNMHNNVVRGLGDGLAARNLLTLRFNYRGVGGSAGPDIDFDAHLVEFWRTSHVANEMELANDVQAAADFLKRTAGDANPIALIGYSFGCALLPGIRVRNLAAYVLLAPTVGKHDLTGFQALRKPKLVIASDDDFAADPREIQTWFEHLPAPKQLVQRRFDNHFFRGHEDWLSDTIAEFLANAGR